MNIVFLGTSHAIPEAHRRCSSILVEVGEKRYLVDMGTQIVEKFMTLKKPMESLKGIFITHMHGDHTNGLISFFDMASWTFKGTDPEIFIPEPTSLTMEAAKLWVECNGNTIRDFKVFPVKEGTIFDDGTVKVTAYMTKHVKNSYAYLFEAEGKRVLFTGDLSGKGPQEDFPVSVFEKPLDLAVCEAGHFPGTAYLPIFGDCKNLKQLCFTHYSDLFIASVLEVQRTLTIPVTIASDDTVISL